MYSQEQIPFSRFLLAADDALRRKGFLQDIESVACGGIMEMLPVAQVEVTLSIIFFLFIDCFDFN
jgi:hypothetical protein